MGIVEPILVGDIAMLDALLGDSGISDCEVLGADDPRQAARIATGLVRDGVADVLVKGKVNSGDFLRAVLDEDTGLRTGRILSHLAVFDVPGQPKLQFYTDGGINVAPDLATKTQILANGVECLHMLGYDRPKVATLTANEQVNRKMPATTDAATLVELSLAGGLPPALVEGPIALDVALSPEAADHKGITSQVSGDVDIFLVPCIEAGNMVGKTLTHVAGARMAGLVLGAAKPVVMSSRSDTADSKLQSIALACLTARRASHEQGEIL